MNKILNKLEDKLAPKMRQYLRNSLMRFSEVFKTQEFLKDRSITYTLLYSIDRGKNCREAHSSPKKKKKLHTLSNF